MKENTAGTPSSSTPSQEERDEAARRSATLEKAISRIIELAEYLEKIDGAIASVIPEFIAGHPMGEAIDTFSSLEVASEKMEKGVKSVMGRLSMAREVSFPARMDAEESKTFTSSTTGNRMTRTSRIFASILSDKTADAFEWLRKHEYGGLIKETVNSSSLSGAAKEMIENGRELPDSLFKTHVKDNVSITKKKAS